MRSAAIVDFMERFGRFDRLRRLSGLGDADLQGSGATAMGLP